MNTIKRRRLKAKRTPWHLSRYNTKGYYESREGHIIFTRKGVFTGIIDWGEKTV